MASEVARAIEAIVMVAEEPIPPHLLAQILEVAPGRVEELCQELAESYLAEDRGFELVRVAGGYRFQSHPDLAGYVERFALEGQSSRLSAAALETLALVAYKQPVSRAQVSEVRGVSVDGVMRTLQHRGYVAEIGRDPGPGQAVLYGTTTRFLEKLGIDSLDALPPLAQFVPGPEVIEALDAGLRHGGGKASPVAVPADGEAGEPDAEHPGPDPNEQVTTETSPVEDEEDLDALYKRPSPDAESTVPAPAPDKEANDPDTETNDLDTETNSRDTETNDPNVTANSPDADVDAEANSPDADGPDADGAAVNAPDVEVDGLYAGGDSQDEGVGGDVEVDSDDIGMDGGDAGIDGNDPEIDGPDQVTLGDETSRLEESADLKPEDPDW